MSECSKCGSKLQKGDLFCSKCGVRLKEKISKPPPKKVRVPIPDKKKPDFSIDAKKRLKKELETAVKAFKSGEITLEQFQEVKKGIIAKARTGFYDRPKKVRILEKKEPSFKKVPAPQNFQVQSHNDESSYEFFETPEERKRESSFSRLWYFVPLLFNILGGIIAYFAIKPVDKGRAKNMVYIGLVSLLLSGTGLAYYFSNSGSDSGAQENESITEIIIENAGLVNEPSPDEALELISTNSSAEKMNLVLNDLEAGFINYEILTGTTSDPDIFSGGNISVLKELKDQNWIENHRTVLQKKLMNSSDVEIEIDSSISRYNSSTLDRDIFEEKIEGLKVKIKDNDYSLIEHDFTGGGFLGKKVEAHEDYEVKLSYTAYFYKYDTFVAFSYVKVGRGEIEEEVIRLLDILDDRII